MKPWWCAVAALTLLVGCDPLADDPGAGGVDTGAGGASAGGDPDTCQAGCEWVERCDLCWPDAGGECMDLTACAETCRARRDEPVASCLAELDACEAQDRVDACFDHTSTAGGPCAEACATLDGCALCDVDAQGECLPFEGCVSACQMDAPGPWAGCVAALASCDEAEVAACYDLGGGDVGDDACAQSCEALDACGFAERDADDVELSVAACAELCRGEMTPERFSCYAEASGETCEAQITACDAVPGDDPCAAACEKLDGCGLCLPAADGECLPAPDCAEACRADPPQRAICVVAVEGCDQAGIDTCLGG